MTEEWAFDPLLAERRKSLEAAGYDVYCMRCRTGKEIMAAKQINKWNEFAVALPFLRLMHKSINGVRSLTQDVLFKSYLFLFLPAEAKVAKVKKGMKTYGVVWTGKDVSPLQGSDLEYAKWVLSMGGIVDVSKAIRVNDKIKIVAGPLLNLEGSIKEYSKKNRNCRVQIGIVGRQINAWLPFDWVESTDGPLDLHFLIE